ncbi:MAG: chorismate mutase [Bacteroides sp.]|nr:chorismate mutase [Bacteroides sp.]
MKLSKKPHACENIQEIRDALDQIDLEIVRLFALRSEYVKEIVKFKGDDKSIVASERRELVIKQRKKWAQESGVDPEMMEEIFKLLIEKNIQMQFNIYKKKDS